MASYPLYERLQWRPVWTTAQLDNSSVGRVDQVPCGALAHALGRDAASQLALIIGGGFDQYGHACLGGFEHSIADTLNPCCLQLFEESGEVSCGA